MITDSSIITDHEVTATAGVDGILVTVDAQTGILLKVEDGNAPQTLRRRLPARLSPLYTGGVDRVGVRLTTVSIDGVRGFAVMFRAGARR